MSRSRPQFPRSTHGTPGTMTSLMETKSGLHFLTRAFLRKPGQDADADCLMHVLREIRIDKMFTVVQFQRACLFHCNSHLHPRFRLWDVSNIVVAFQHSTKQT